MTKYSVVLRPYDKYICSGGWTLSEACFRLVLWQANLPELKSSIVVIDEHGSVVDEVIIKAEIEGIMRLLGKHS